MKRYDLIPVVDVETTCWDGTRPTGMYNDIIEIGVSVLDVVKLEPGAPFSVMVKPTTSKVSEFCTALTGITKDMLEGPGVLAFVHACEEIHRHWYKRTHGRIRERLWASWGDFDRVQFRRQCEREDVAYPFAKGHLNVKDLFALAYRLDHPVGMAEALKIMGLKLIGRHHSGKDDAFNVARILATLIEWLKAKGGMK